jgi:hypothetical protein
MAVLGVAISPKAMALLSGTPIGEFIAEGVEQPDGTRQITTNVGTIAQLQAMNAPEHQALIGRFIALVGQAQGGQGQAGSGNVSSNERL